MRTGFIQASPIIHRYRLATWPHNTSVFHLQNKARISIIGKNLWVASEKTPLLRTEHCVPLPQAPVWKPYSPVWRCEEVGPWGDNLCLDKAVLVEPPGGILEPVQESPEFASFPCCLPCDGTMRSHRVLPGRWLSPEFGHAGTPISVFRPPELREIVCKPAVCGALSWQPEGTKTPVFNYLKETGI